MCDKGKNVDNKQKVRYQYDNSIWPYIAGLMIRPVWADDQWDTAVVLVDSPWEQVCIRLADRI